MIDLHPEWADHEQDVLDTLANISQICDIKNNQRAKKGRKMQNQMVQPTRIHYQGM